MSQLRCHPEISVCLHLCFVMAHRFIFRLFKWNCEITIRFRNKPICHHLEPLFQRCKCSTLVLTTSSMSKQIYINCQFQESRLRQVTAGLIIGAISVYLLARPAKHQEHRSQKGRPLSGRRVLPGTLVRGVSQSHIFADLGREEWNQNTPCCFGVLRDRPQVI